MTTLRAQGRKLARIRRSLGYSQLQLAIRAGVSERTVRNAECGHSVKRDFLVYIASGLQVPLFEVLEDEFACDSKWIARAETIQEELSRAITAMNSDLKINASSSTLGTPTTNHPIGANLLDELLVQARRQGFNIREFVRSGPHCSCRMTFDTPLFNRSTVTVRGCICASSQTVVKTLRWILICTISGTDIERVEAFCDTCEPCAAASQVEVSQP